MDKGSFFILNIFLNSVLVFFTAALLVESLILLFRIRQGRLAACLRMIPILKLPLDLYLYDFSRWSYARGINPLECEEGTRMLSLMFSWNEGVFEGVYFPITSCIELTAPGNLTFTIADLVGYHINPSVLKILALAFLSFTAACACRKLIAYYQSISTLGTLSEKSHVLNRKIRNPALSSRVKKSGIQILCTPTIKGSPFVAGLVASVVYIPTTLSEALTRKEYEAVLAHELEHVRYKDSLVRLILDFIRTVFWWVPTKWLYNRIEEGQEVGCDLKSERYGVDLTNLASAICKSSRGISRDRIEASDHVFAHHLTKQSAMERINTLLNPPVIRYKKLSFACGCLAMGIAILAIFLGRFWMF